MTPYNFREEYKGWEKEVQKPDPPDPGEYMEDTKIRCPCCGVSQPWFSKERPYCDDCDTDSCGHWPLDS